ncbi:BnaA09g46970D [Brassica napus]|uniref:BnaA09g46970D protein n=1 Tax=Brassica napus TaxID=3708 RepID=A0A078GJB1_BRANA|nr:BnaA09g46970D [Brassica napus]
MLITMMIVMEIDHTDYFCKLGCATHHCISLSSLRNPNAEKIVECVDSCSDKCSNKN